MRRSKLPPLRALRSQITQMFWEQIAFIRASAMYPQKPHTRVEWMGGLLIALLIGVTATAPERIFLIFNVEVLHAAPSLIWRAANIAFAIYVVLWVREMPAPVKWRMVLWIVFLCGSYSRNSSGLAAFTLSAILLNAAISLDLFRLLFRPTIYEKQATQDIMIRHQALRIAQLEDELDEHINSRTP